MRQLHELPAEAILEELQLRGEVWARMKYMATLAENNHTQAKAAVYSALRKIGGITVEDAKTQALDNETVTNAYVEWAKADREKDLAYISLERARTAADMWRSEQANRRRV